MEELAAALQARRFIAGQYVRGIFGGDRRVRERGAGLALREWRVEGGSLKLRLWNTAADLEAPLDVVAAHGIGVYKLVYVGSVRPFCVAGTYDVLLSRRGEAGLRGFLRWVAERHRGLLDAREAEMVERLARTARQGRVEELDPGCAYAVYRCEGALAAAALRPAAGTVLDSHLGAIELDSDDMAHYYAAAINYIAHKALESGRTPACYKRWRPPLAVLVAGLAWGSVDGGVRREVAELARRLASSWCQRASSLTIAESVEALDGAPEFAGIERLLDGFVEEAGLQGRLKLAFELVSGQPAAESRKRGRRFPGPPGASDLCQTGGGKRETEGGALRERESRPRCKR